jgi:AraC-like DNA-binding protein
MERHQHYALQLSVALDGQAALRLPPADWEEFEAAIVASGVPHSLDPRGTWLATIMVEPLSPHGRGLVRRLGGAAMLRLRAGEVAPLRAVAERLRQGELRSSDCVDAARALLDALAATGPARREPDRRVAAMCTYIQEHVRDPQVTLAQVAAAAYLSPERARHLFRAETGLGIRPYVLWTRLNTAVHGLPEADQLTAVAHESGFADAAHFTRTFRSMYGIAPSSLLRASA